ncbi:MAG TPA: peptidase S58 family protein [Rhodobacteraceae bacterium]|nr:peptidase S58 family protein [Paracoccaceae bacterium]
MKPGPQNLITDIDGLRVGNVEDARIRSGVSVVVFDEPVTASVDVRGGAPGTRDTELLDPEKTVAGVDALVLSGGSAFGLDAASGVQAFLKEQGRGFQVGAALVPIVPQAILFDLINGGDKDWGRYPPYREWGYEAAGAAGRDFSLGRAGAGFGATTAGGPGGLGSASMALDGGLIVGALVAVNALGSASIGPTRHFWAAPFEIGDEYGGLGLPPEMKPEWLLPKLKGESQAVSAQNTTIAIIATNAALDKAQCRRLAVMAQDGMARALMPAHTPLDGDLVFAAATGAQELRDPLAGLIRLGHSAAMVLARAIARGVYLACG